MTKACEKLYKKLDKGQQKAIKDRVEDIKRDPTSGRPLQDRELEGLLHTHARGKSSNLLVIWSHENKLKRVIIEAVGPHKIMEWLARQKKIFREGL